VAGLSLLLAGEPNRNSAFVLRHLYSTFRIHDPTNFLSGTFENHWILEIIEMFAEGKKPPSRGIAAST
jgi:hypothetical protein